MLENSDNFSNIDEINNNNIDDTIDNAIKMLKTPVFDKRIQGVKSLSRIIISKIKDEDSLQKIIKKIKDNNVINEIFTTESHSQLISKSKEIVELFLKKDQLDERELLFILERTKKGDLQGKLNILELFTELSSNLKPNHINILLDNIYSEETEEFKKKEINLLYKLSTQSKDETNLYKCLNVLFNLIKNSKNNTDNQDTLDLIGKVIDISSTNKQFLDSVIEFCAVCIEMNKQPNIAFKILDIISCQGNPQSIFAKIVDNNRILNAYLNNFKQYKLRAKEVIKDKNNENIIVDGASHLNNIKWRMAFSTVILQLYPHFDYFPFFVDILLNEPVCKYDINCFFEYVQNAIQNSSVNKLKMEEQIFDLFILKDNEHFHLSNNITSTIFEVFIECFFTINIKKGNIIPTSTSTSTSNTMSLNNEDTFDIFDLGKNNFNLNKPPNELIGFDILWNIILDSNANEIIDKSLQILIALFKNNIDRLLAMFTDVIKSKKDFSRIKKCFKMLILLIENSEKQGISHIKSHLNLCKSKEIKFSVVFYRKGRIDTFNLKLYANTTLSELKEICCKRMKIPFEVANIEFQHNSYTDDKDNIKTLQSIELSEGDTINLSESTQNYKAPLIEKGNLSIRFKSILNEWFDMYSQNDKMTHETCALFLASVTTSKETVKPDDKRILKLFHEYGEGKEKEKEGYISREGFLKFYKQSANDKPFIVWENLKNKKIRYDLRKIDDPMELPYLQSQNLPRYKLGNDLNLINCLFDLFNERPELGQEIYEMLFSLSSNEEMYENLLEGEGRGKEFNNGNILFDLYTMHFVKSIIEDIKFKERNDSCPYVPFDERDGRDRREEKMKYIIKMIETGGYAKLIECFCNIVNKGKNTGYQFDKLMEMLMEEMLTLIKIVFIATLFDFNEKEFDNNESDEGKNYLNRRHSLNRSNNNQIKINNNNYENKALMELIKEKNLRDLINKDIANSSLIKTLIPFIYNSIDESFENLNLTTLSFDFMLGILAFNSQLDNSFEYEKKGLRTLILKFFSLQNQKYVNSYIKTLSNYTKISNNIGNYDFIIVLFSIITSIITEISQPNSMNNEQSNEIYGYFFDYSILLYEIVSNLSAKNEEINIKISSLDIKIDDFILKMFDNIYDELDLTKRKFPSGIFNGFIKFITKAIDNSAILKEQILSISKNGKNIVDILEKIIFTNEDEDKQLIIENGKKFISLTDIKNKTTTNNKNQNQEANNEIFNFFIALIQNTNRIINVFLKINEIKELKDESKKYTYNTRERTFGVYSLSSNRGKQEGHVGLKNLGAICYMNSIMQQIYMVPTFRYAILQSDDNKEEQTSNYEKIDDNILHQLQKMFTFLTLSEKEDYNPKEFCYSFKDFDGTPTSTIIQQDSQEFLVAFCDKIENSLKETKFKYIVNDVFSGKTCSQVVCGDCQYVSNRFEDCYNLTLEVQEMRDLNESLNKYFFPEQIDGFKCEKCGKRVTITKRSSFCELPNVLIIHLKRFQMNEIGHIEKINSRLKFPFTLNLKKFCTEDIMHKTTPDYETELIYSKVEEYYDYALKGVNVHIGSADSGHYFSFINTIRDGKGNIIQENSSEENSSWLKFNDSNVSQFDLNTVSEEWFGGAYNNFYQEIENSQNAYLLVYEKRKKKPVKVILNKEEINQIDKEILISYKKEEGDILRKAIDLYRDVKAPLKEENSLNLEILKGKIDVNNIEEVKNKISSFIFYDEAKNEYYKYINFYDVSKEIPVRYYKEVQCDNKQFIKNLNNEDSVKTKFYIKVKEEFQIYLQTNPTFDENLNESEIPKLANAIISLLFKLIQSDSHYNKTSLTELNHKLVFFLNIFKKYIFKDEKCLNILINSFKEEKFKSVFSVSESLEDFMGEFVEILKIVIEKVKTNEDIKEFAKTLIDYSVKFSTRGLIKKNSFFKLLKIEFDNLHEEFIKKVYSDSNFKNFISIIDIEEKFKSLEPKVNESLNVIVSLFGEIIKRSHEFNNNKYIEEKDKTEKDKVLYSLKYYINYLRKPSILQVISKVNVEVYINLFFLLYEEEEEHSFNFMEETALNLISILEQLSLEQGDKILQIFKVLYTILSFDDQWNFDKYLLILGHPEFIVECENKKDSEFPLFGYHIMKDKTSKYIRYISKERSKKINCIITKLEELESDDYNKTLVEIYMLLLETASIKSSLFKYLYLIPSTTLQYDNYYHSIIEKIEKWIKSELIDQQQRDEYTKRIDKIKEKSQILIQYISEQKERENEDNKEDEMDYEKEEEELIYNQFDKNKPDDLSWFKGFINDYLPKDIVKEEIHYVCKGEGMVLLRFDYYTTIIPLSPLPSKTEIDFSQSYQNCTPEKMEIKVTSKAEYSSLEIENQNLKREKDERQFLKNYYDKRNLSSTYLFKNTKLEREKNNHLVLLRYVLWNSQLKKAQVVFKVKAMRSIRKLEDLKKLNFPSNFLDIVNGKNFTDVQKIHPFKYQEPFQLKEKIAFSINVIWENEIF